MPKEGLENVRPPPNGDQAQNRAPIRLSNALKQDSFTHVIQTKSNEPSSLSNFQTNMLSPPRLSSGDASLYRARGFDTESRSPEIVNGGQVGAPPCSTEGMESILSTVDILSLTLNGIINSRTRHLIKRYLKKVGFMNVKVAYKPDCGPSTMTLFVTGQVDHEPTDEQRMKLKHLNDALTYTLTQSMAGLDPHPSHADPEILRRALTEMEPSMRNVYYNRA